MPEDRESPPWANAGLPRPFVIQEIAQETGRVKRFALSGPLPAQPGQFAMLWLPGIDEKPFSLMHDDPLTIAVAQVGPFTEALHARRTGDSVWARGPFGRGFTIVGARLLLIGGGYGAAPLAFLARRARAQGAHVAAVLGARTAGDLLLPGHFRSLGCEVLTCTDDGSDGHCMLADEAARRALDAGAYDALYACGPAPMLAAVEALARQRELPAQLSREAFMRCGIGVCGSCSCGDQLVCRDGPVFAVGGAPGLAR